MEPIKVDPDKVIKVEPKMIREVGGGGGGIIIAIIIFIIILSLIF